MRGKEWPWLVALNVVAAALLALGPDIAGSQGSAPIMQRTTPLFFIHPDVVTPTVHTAAMELATRSAPPPAALDSSVRIFVHASNTTGKSLLCAQFRTGVPQCFSQEP